MNSHNEPAAGTVEPIIGSFGAVAPYYDHLMSHVPYRYWLDYVEALWKRHCVAVKSVVDLACGTGTMTLLLAERGYRVIGVDLSEGMLTAARGKSAAFPDVSYMQQDASGLDLPEKPWDAIVCLFDSMNYILDSRALQRAFVSARENLKTGGAFIFDVNTRYALEEGMFNQSCSRRAEPLHYRWRSRFDPCTDICTVSMVFHFDDGSGERRTFRESHKQRAYPKDAIVDWLREAGFLEVSVYDAYTFDPAYKRSDRIFFVAVC